MATAGSIVVSLLASTGSFETDIERSTKNAERRFKQMERTVDQWARRLTAGAGAAAAAFTAWAMGMSRSMDATLKMADQIGTTTEALTGLRYAAQQMANVSDGTFDMALRRMTRRIAEAAEGGGAATKALEELGLNARQLSNLSVDEQFLRLADAMQKTERQGSRLRHTMAIFDTEGMPLVNALSQGSAEIQKFVEEAERFGLVVSTDAARAASDFQTEISRLQAMLSGLSVGLANEVLPTLNDFISRATAAATETGGLHDEIKELTGDSALKQWFDAGLVGFARIADVAVFLAKAVGVVGGAFRSVAADAEVALAAINKAQAWNWFSDEASNELQAALARRNQIVGGFNQDLADLFTYQGNKFEQAALASINTIKVQSDAVKLIDLTLEDAADSANKNTKATRANAAALTEAQRAAQAFRREQEQSLRYIAAINRELDVFQQQQNLTIAGIGMGDRQREQMEREMAVRQDYAERRRQLEEAQQVESTRLSEDQYQRRIQALQDAEQRQIQILRDAAVLKAQAEGDWTNGAIRGLQNYSDEVANVADSVAQAVGSSFRGMEDAIVSFVRTGKADFRSLADSIISDLVRIAAQQSVTGPIAAWMGGLFASSAAPAGVIPGLNWMFASGGYTGDGGKYEPAGIVHRGEGVLNREEISALGGEPGFNALRRALRTGHAVGGMAGRPSLPPVGRGAPSVELNIINQSGQPVGAGQPRVRMGDAGRLVIDVMLTDLRNNGPYVRQLKGALG